MDKNEKIDDLVAMIDNLMASGQGHVNVFSDGEELNCEATVSKDCGCNGKSACSQPTVFFEEDGEEE